MSVIATVDELGNPRTIPNAEGEALTPSAVFFEGDGVIVGREALRALQSDPQDVALHAKRELGTRTYPHAVGGRYYPPAALEAWVLNKLRLDASRQIGSIAQAVITVPAYFDDVRRQATQDAGFMAGLDVLEILNEPTAAAIAFGHSLGRESTGTSQRLLVFDLGGGTFDVTILEWSETGFTVLATDGDSRLGGVDFDERLLDRLAAEFAHRYHSDPREDPLARARWWRECEETKKTLSVRQRASFVGDCQGQLWRREVARDEFESWTHDLLERTRFTVSESVAASGLAWPDIDRVLLVGGSTRLPAVRAMLRQLSGREPDISLSPDEAVAHGAALRAAFHRVSGEMRPALRLQDVNSHSLGVAGTDALTRQPRVAVLIPRNSPLPSIARRVFKTQKDDQRSLLVPIIEGESQHPDECVSLGQCVIPSLPPGLPAHSPVEVCFQYDVNGRLGIHVHVVGTGVELRHELQRENSMTDEQRDAWREHIAQLPAVGRQD